MKFTPEQKAQILREKQADPSKTSFRFTPTPEQREYLERAYQEEMANKEANIARMRRLESLLAEDSFLGALRRALDESEKTWDEHSQDTDIPAQRIQKFYCGDAELTLGEVDRLIAGLGLHLVPISG